MAVPSLSTSKAIHHCCGSFATSSASLARNSAVADAEITTIEGLDPNGLHPLQKAWIELQVPQCGYCQSGQIMQAASLLKDFPTPSDQDIDAVMTGNLCRCMTYIRIRRAIKQAAAELRKGASND